MSGYQGIENVDPTELARQRALTETLWSELKLKKEGKNTSGSIECIFRAANQDAAETLLSLFTWKAQIRETGHADKPWCIRIETDRAYLTREALLELVEVALIAAFESGCEFDGFEIDLHNLQHHAWWKLW